jgi:cytochrome c peroxidase
MRIAAGRAILAAVAALSGGVAGAMDKAGLSPTEQLGKSIFFDTALSANGNQACASCHDPAMGFTAPVAAVNRAGAVMEGSFAGRFGNRKPPSAAYAAESPTLHHIVEDGEVIFVGGAFLDGRATGGKLGHPTADQAQGPFLNPMEMAMPSPACVVARVLSPADPSAYPVSYADAWGKPDLTLPEDIAARCADPDARIELDEASTAAVDDIFGKIALSVSAYEQTTEMQPFNSRYDRWKRGEGTLSDQELAGLKLFEDPAKGNCAACHVLGPNTRGGPSVFTDWTFDNLGVPRNRDNPFYADARNKDGRQWVDKGLGGFLETDPIYASLAPENMGRQQVPTLRNLTKGATADIPRAYMHNGWFKTLEGVVHFYNTRDVLPACADPWANEAEAMAKGCWPVAEIPATVNKDELGNLKLSADEEAAIVAFLRTLDDE